MVALLLLMACAHTEHAAVAFQFVRSGKRSIENDGGGLAVFGLPSEEEEVGGFVEAHLSWSGDVNGPRYEEVPITSANDPVVDRQAIAGTLHFGPTFRVTDWLYAYAGLGVGNRYVQEQRFDNSFTLSDDGNYRRPGRNHFRGSGTVGVLLQPYDGSLLGIGYDAFFEGLVISFGFAW
jgi:opacity protein-like surface antigen